MDAAVVTGAGRGLGRATARRLAAEGYAVAVNDTDAEPAEETARLVREEGGEAIVCQRDVTAEGAADDLVSEAVSAFGGLDVLVNNAAVETVAPVLDLSDEEWDRVIDVNLTAVFRLSRAAGRRFRDQGSGGDIVNISSVHDTRPRTGKIHYDTAKAGVWMLTKDLALALAPDGVAVNCVAPGVMATPMNEVLQNDPEAMAAQRERIPMGRLGDPEAVADAVAYLVDAEYVTGTRIAVDGGVSLVD